MQLVEERHGNQQALSRLSDQLLEAKARHRATEEQLSTSHEELATCREQSRRLERDASEARQRAEVSDGCVLATPLLCGCHVRECVLLCCRICSRSSIKRTPS